MTTQHTEIGYANNVDIIERAMREKFGVYDQSHIQRAVAAHIWSVVCEQYGEEKQWGETEIMNAITQCQARLKTMMEELRCDRPGCAVSYPHTTH